MDAGCNSFPSKKTADSLVQAAQLNRRERIKAAARIRRIYADFMELCENLELARADSQTPLRILATGSPNVPANQQGD